jgi:hypothetical protein
MGWKKRGFPRMGSGKSHEAAETATKNVTSLAFLSRDGSVGIEAMLP